MGGPVASIDVGLLREHLVNMAEHESELTDHVYRKLFAEHPDAAELFGTYSRANQQRMMAETLGAVLGMIDQEPWLGGYVHAMGSRHQFSYETPADLYAPYAEAILDALAALSGDDWTKELADSWKAALVQVNQMMVDGYVPTSHRQACVSAQRPETPYSTLRRVFSSVCAKISLCPLMRSCVFSEYVKEPSS